MKELSPTARAILIAACIHHDGYLYADLGNVRGGPAIQVRKGLEKANLVARETYTGQGHAFEGEVGHYALRVTEAGREAVADQLAAHDAANAPQSATAAPGGQDKPDEGAPAPAAAAKPARAGSKQSLMIEMLKRPEGATVDEIAKRFDWKPHTTRAAISVLAKKDRANGPTSEKVEGRGRVYRIAA